MGEGIDELVFRPLERRFLEKPFDERGIRDYVASHGLPPSIMRSYNESTLRGFIFELNMRLAVGNVLDGVLRFLPERSLRGSYLVVRTTYDAVVMFRNGDIHDAIEMDCLMELQVDRTSVPIIFEAKAGTGGGFGYQKRISWVRSAFNEYPYFCVVRPKKPNGPEGLFIDPQLGNHRTLAIPTNGEVLEMAHYLMKNR